MRIIVRGASTALVYLSDASRPGFSRVGIAVFLFVSLVICIVLLTIFHLKYNDKMSLDIKQTYLSGYEKVMCFISCPLTMLWFAICFAVTIYTVPITMTI